MSTDPQHPAEDPDPGLDVDARFAEIVAGWGPDEPSPDAPGSAEEDAPAAGPSERDRLRGLFRAVWDEPPGESPAPPADEDHFEPPPPPPLPQLDPPRRLAWAGLLGAPLVALLAVAAGISLPGWAALLLVACFVGGFGYLVATMRSGPPDDWSDDGARL